MREHKARTVWRSLRVCFCKTRERNLDFIPRATDSRQRFTKWGASIWLALHSRETSLAATRAVATRGAGSLGTHCDPERGWVHPTAPHTPHNTVTTPLPHPPALHQTAHSATSEASSRLITAVPPGLQQTANIRGVLNAQ